MQDLTIFASSFSPPFPAERSSGLYINSRIDPSPFPRLPSISLRRAVLLVSALLGLFVQPSPVDAQAPIVKVREEPIFFFHGSGISPSVWRDSLDAAWADARDHFVAFCAARSGTYTTACVTTDECTVLPPEPETFYPSNNGIALRYNVRHKATWTDHCTVPPSTSTQGFDVNVDAVDSYYQCAYGFSAVPKLVAPKTYEVICEKTLPSSVPARCPATSNPVALTGGLKVWDRVDYDDPTGDLTLRATYWSDLGEFVSVLDSHLVDYSVTGILPIGRREVFERNPGETVVRSVSYVGAGQASAGVQLNTAGPNLRSITFVPSTTAGSYRADPAFASQQLRKLNPVVNGAAWALKQDSYVDYFGSNGKLVRRARATGRTITFEYGAAAQATLSSASLVGALKLTTTHKDACWWLVRLRGKRFALSTLPLEIAAPRAANSRRASPLQTTTLTNTNTVSQNMCPGLVTTTTTYLLAL